MRTIIGEEGAAHTVDSLLEDLKKIIVVHLSEIYGLNKIWGHARVDPYKAFDKDLDHRGKRVVQEMRGALIQLLSTTYLKKHGRLPPVKFPGNHPKLQQWFDLAHVDIDQTMSGGPILFQIDQKWFSTEPFGLTQSLTSHL